MASLCIAAFDLATNTGIAVGDTSGSPTCMTEKLGTSADSHGKRGLQAMYMTRRIIEEWKPDLIAIERPIITSGREKMNTPFLLIGLRMVVHAVAELKHVRVADYSVQTARAHFIQAGNLGRAEAKSKVYDTCHMLGWRPANHDEADACAIWEAARVECKVSDMMPVDGLFKVKR